MRPFMFFKNEEYGINKSLLRGYLYLLDEWYINRGCNYDDDILVDCLSLIRRDFVTTYEHVRGFYRLNYHSDNITLSDQDHEDLISITTLDSSLFNEEGETFS
jgi:hypothetical protein